MCGAPDVSFIPSKDPITSEPRGRDRHMPYGTSAPSQARVAARGLTKWWLLRHLHIPLFAGRIHRLAHVEPGGLLLSSASLRKWFGSRLLLLRSSRRTGGAGRSSTFLIITPLEEPSVTNTIA